MTSIGLDTRVALLEQAQEHHTKSLDEMRMNFSEFRADIKELLDLKQKWKVGAIFIFTLGAFAAWIIDHTQAIGRWFSRFI